VVVTVVVRGRRGLSFGWIQERNYSAFRAAVYSHGDHCTMIERSYCTVLISLASPPLHNTSSYILNERI
jgi:hypothetical protein